MFASLPRTTEHTEHDHVAKVSTTRWLLNPGMPRDRDKVYAELTTQYWANYKAFTSRLTWLIKTPMGTEVRSSTHASKPVGPSITVGRFSRDLLESTHRDAISEIDRHFSQYCWLFNDALEGRKKVSA